MFDYCKYEGGLIRDVANWALPPLASRKIQENTPPGKLWCSKVPSDRGLYACTHINTRMVNVVYRAKLQVVYHSETWSNTMLSKHI